MAWGGSSNSSDSPSGLTDKLLSSITGNTVENESTWKAVSWVSGYCVLGAVADIGANTVAGDFIGLDAIGSWIMKFACAPLLSYIFLYLPASFLLQLSVVIFDFCLSLSLNALYINQAFISNIWGTMRDVSNMLFIFILLYAGITTMLNIAQTDWRKTVTRVIVVALLINFSLFFTQVVIDAGNTVGVGIYNSMGVAGQTVIVDGKETQSQRSIGGALVSTFSLGNFVGQNQGGFIDSLIIFSLVAVIDVIVAWVLFTIGLIFIGRLLAFWVLMIAAPLAFISSALPPSLNKFQDWFDTLIKQAFLAPVFLFMLYLIILISGPLLSLRSQLSGGGTGLVYEAVVPVLGAVLVVVALIEAKKYTVKMSGKIGELSGSVGGKIMGSAAGLALGGVGFAGRRIIGGGANRLLESGKLKQLATSDNAVARWAGRQSIVLADTARKGSFDVRESSVVGYTKAGFGAAGVKMADLGESTGKGGYVQSEKDWEKKAMEKAKSMDVSNAEKEAKKAQLDSGYQQSKETLEKQYQEKRTAALELKKAEIMLEEAPESKKLIEKVNKAKEEVSSKLKQTEANEDKLSKLKTRLVEANDPEQIDEIKKQIEQTRKDGITAANNYVNSEANLTKAKMEYAIGAPEETKKLQTLIKEAKEKSVKADKAFDSTEKIVKEIDKKTDDWAKLENERRREGSARHSVAEHFVMSRTSRQTIISKIRKGVTEKDKKEKKRNEVLEDFAKEAAEKKKEEEGPKEPETEKKE